MLTVRSTINFASQTVPPIIPVVQGDPGRAILFTLADFTIPAGATATYYVQKPSGEAVYNNATIDGNNVLVNLTAQSIIEKGDNYGQVRIAVGGDVVTSFDFILLVKEFRGIEAVQSLTEMNIFDKAVEQAADAIDEVKTDALDDIGDAKDAALQEIEQTTGNFADDFSASATYAAGDYVIHSGQLYRFTANHAAGAWTGSDAEAVTVGEELTDLKADTNTLKEDFDTLVNESFLLEENSNVVAQADGWRLNASDGLCSSSSNYCLKKYTVTAGDFVYVVSDDRFQFQDKLSVPSSGTSNRVGVTYGIGKRILKVPNGATCLIFSTPKTNSTAKMYFANSSLDEITDSLSRLNENIDDVLDIGTVNPVNWLNMDATTVGRILWDGTQDTSTSYKTTDYIPINNGDVLRLYNTYWNSDTSRYELSAVSGERLALYGANKNYLSVSGQYPINTSTGYTVSNADAKYVRLSFTSSYTKAEVTKNVAELVYSDYFSPYVESQRISRIENEIGSSPKKIIDCWGDSRTEMNIGTSYSDYLSALLGDPYIVTNRGLSGQSIGQVAFRFGANETFLTLENNVIPASGSVNITGVLCSVGSRQGYNMETADSTRGSRCSINGVQGTFVYHRSGAKTFTRDSAGVAVNVFPATKAIPEPYFDKSHMQIMWAGKNDFSYSSPYVKSGIKANYDAMVSMIPHSRFIILGETYSNSSDYASGTENREVVDNINDYLAEKYPNNFINLQTELVANGLTLEGITPTAQDSSDISVGFIPTSLMNDVTHPNQYGREAIAKIIYQYMTNWGWLS